MPPPNPGGPIEPWTVLAICGSLRRGSHNAALLELAGAVRSDVVLSGAGMAGRLPLFNPDLDTEQALPPAVAEFRACAERAHGIVIATPEYAHGPSGVTKNAMDWLVGSGGMADRPTLLMAASPGQAGGLRGHLPLIPALTLMGAHLVDSVTVSRAAARLRGGGAAGADADVVARVRAAMGELAAAMEYADRRAAARRPLPRVL
ncbi:NAD(P)H-dependent oxidoreductase [Nocardiopsis coralliicola]